MCREFYLPTVSVSQGPEVSQGWALILRVERMLLAGKAASLCQLMCRFTNQKSRLSSLQTTQNDRWKFQTPYLSMVAHAYNISTQEADAGESEIRVIFNWIATGQPGLPKTFPQAKQKSQSLELVELRFKEEEVFFQEMNVFQPVLSFSSVQ